MSRQSGKTAFPPASFERRGSGKALGQGAEGKQADGEGRPEDRSRRRAGGLTPRTGRAAQRNSAGIEAAEEGSRRRDARQQGRKHAAPHRKGKDRLA